MVFFTPSGLLSVWVHRELASEFMGPGSWVTRENFQNKWKTFIGKPSLALWKLFWSSHLPRGDLELVQCSPAPVICSSCHRERCGWLASALLWKHTLLPTQFTCWYMVFLDIWVFPHHCHVCAMLVNDSIVCVCVCTCVYVPYFLECWQMAPPVSPGPHTASSVKRPSWPWG